MRPSWRDEAEEPAPQGDADAVRRPRNASATAANRRLKLRQRPQAARSLQAAKSKPEYYAIRDLAATGEDLVRQQTLQARKIVPKALPNLILKLHVPYAANRLAGVQQNFWGLYAKVTMGRSRP